MNIRTLTLLAAVSASALVLAGCGGDQQDQAQQPAKTEGRPALTSGRAPPTERR